VLIPSDAKVLNYSIFAEDESGNNMVIEKYRHIIDNDPPEIIDCSKALAETCNLYVEVYDNTEIESVKVYYWAEDGIINIIELQLINGFYQGYITTYEDSTKYYYVIEALDTSGNKQVTQEQKLFLVKDESTSPSSLISADNFWIMLLIIVIMGGLSIFFSMVKQGGTQKKPQVEDEFFEDYEMAQRRTRPMENYDYFPSLPPQLEGSLTVDEQSKTKAVAIPQAKGEVKLLPPQGTQPTTTAHKKTQGEDATEFLQTTPIISPKLITQTELDSEQQLPTPEPESSIKNQPEKDLTKDDVDKISDIGGSENE
jgi:hypothetical protein